MMVSLTSCERRRESRKLSTSFKIMVYCKHVHGCFLCKMNFGGFSARTLEAKTVSRLYSINVIGASPSQAERNMLLMFRF